ncbi:unnamed protein product, partial [Ectocarpus sp. 12 AP-2014]
MPVRRTSRRSVIAGAIPVGRTAGRSVVAGAAPAGKTVRGCVGRAAGRDGVVAGAISAGRTAGKEECHPERNISRGSRKEGGMSSRDLQRYSGDIHMHVINALLFFIVVGVWRGTNLALAVAGGKEVGM